VKKRAAKKQAGDKRFPDLFWQAGQEEFEVSDGSTECLAMLIRGSGPDSEAPPHLREKASQKLEEWIKQERASDHASATFSRLAKAERYNNNAERRYPAVRRVALLSYLFLVDLAEKKRIQEITQDLLWTVIQSQYSLNGFTPPHDTSRKRVMKELGLDEILPGTPPGRPKKN